MPRCATPGLGEGQVETLMQNIAGQVVISPEVYAETEKKIKNIPDFKARIEEYLEQDVTRLVEIILTGGVVLNASDIHIEPEEKQTRIRARIDGVLQDVAVIDPKTYETLLSRIKLLSGIKFNIE